MSKRAFIAAGDLHLDHLIWRKLHSVTGDAALGFDSLIHYAIEWHLPLVLVGDVFDSSSPQPSVVDMFRRGMDLLAKESVPVYVIQGNHDKREVPWPSATHDLPKWIGNGVQTTVGGVSCVGFDYEMKENIHSKLLELADRPHLPSVLFMHQACKQALKFEGRWNCDLELVPEGIPLTVMGDIHTAWAEDIREGQHALYTNATHPRNMAERGDKGFVVVNTDLTYERIPLPVRPMEVFSVYSRSQLDEMVTWVKTACMGAPLPPYVKMKYSPEMLCEVERALVDLREEAIIDAKSLGVIPGLDFDIEDDSPKDALLDLGALVTEQVPPSPPGEVGAHGLVMALVTQTDDITDIIDAFRTAVKDNHGH